MLNTRKHPYTKIIETFSAQEMDLIVQLKRFFEWLEGDIEFNEAVINNRLSTPQLKRLREIGVFFDIKELALIWEKPQLFLKCTGELACNNTGAAVDKEEEKLIEQYPLISLWLKHCKLKKRLYLGAKKRAWRVPKNNRFDSWRLRRIKAIKSELGLFGYHIDHPVFAFELGDGCTVGCWFCAFASKKLSKNFDYEENSTYFKKIVQLCVELFGKDATGMALLYYGTEPHDNPGYIDFIKDFHNITGHPVCTATTAAADATWIRELIAYYRQGNYPWPRLSVLSQEMLLEIHETYSPEELRDVSLLMQMKDHQRDKVTGGRILGEHEGLKGRESGHYLEGIVPQGSIACVSGFLINMVHQTIQLVSPCYTSKKWPYGYRVFDQVSFTDETDFKKAMEKLIERNMADKPIPAAKAEFRDDLNFQTTPKGFDLISPNQIHHFEGGGLYRDLGKLVASGNKTYKELFDTLIDNSHYNPLAIFSFVKELFDSGLLNEKYNYGIKGK